MARIAKGVLFELDGPLGPLRRQAVADPYSHGLEQAVLPDAEEIARAIRGVANG